MNFVVLGIFLRDKIPDIVTRKLSLATTLIVQSTLLKAEGIRIREKGESAGNKTVPKDFCTSPWRIPAKSSLSARVSTTKAASFSSRE